MAVVQALQAGSSALRRNPSIIGIMVIISLLQVPTQFAPLTGPLASAVLGLGVSLLSLLLIPFIFAGMLGMADEALDGKTSVDTFVETGKQYYTSMLGAYLLVLGGSLVLGIVAAIAFAVFGIAVFSVVGGVPGVGVSRVILGGIVIVVVGMFLFFPLFFIQFYGQAIVLNGQGAIRSFKRSVSLVRRTLWSVFGYSVFMFGIGLVFGLGSGVPSTLLSVQTAQPSAVPGFPDIPLSILAGLIIVGAVVMGLIGGLFLTFSAAFYRSLDSTATDAELSTIQGASNCILHREEGDMPDKTEQDVVIVGCGPGGILRRIRCKARKEGVIPEAVAECTWGGTSDKYTVRARVDGNGWIERSLTTFASSANPDVRCAIAEARHRDSHLQRILDAGYDRATTKRVHLRPKSSNLVSQLGSSEFSTLSNSTDD